MEAEERHGVLSRLLDDLTCRSVEASRHQLDDERKSARLITAALTHVPALLSLGRHTLDDARLEDGLLGLGKHEGTVGLHKNLVDRNVITIQQ